jgi:ribonuclease D
LKNINCNSNGTITEGGCQYGVSISKEDLAELPAAIYNKRIYLVDTEEEAEKAAEKLRMSDVIGFDTETRPAFRSGQSYTVALMQLATREECYLIRLKHIGLPESIKKILEDPEILKIGLSIRDDFHSLHKAFELNPAGFIDLQQFVKQYAIVDNSLSRIYGILFNHRISKGQRLTNWEADQLTQHQQEYAALDALACITIYDKLTQNGFDPKNSPYYKLIYDPSQDEQQEETT